MRRRFLVATLLLASLGRSCEWDRDTLAEEANLGNDDLATIVGRFPRNPPLFYAMRRDRILAQKARLVTDYDDLAVAYDKLGDPLNAIRWIDRKPQGDAESRYRTLANRGTFLVHAWLAGKASRHDAERGLKSLKAAVWLNPNAHFGRERVQIELVKDFLDPTKASYAISYDGDQVSRGKRDAEGYAGIVRLGAGWESPDVFRALAASLGAAGLGALGTASVDRAEELEREGKKPRLDPEEVFGYIEGTQPPGPLRDDTRTQFERLRAEADAWQARRTAFMLARLKAGRHPDTDPDFWKGWIDAAPPRVTTDLVKLDGWGASLPRRTYGFLVLSLSACALTPLGILSAIILRRRRSSRI